MRETGLRPMPEDMRRLLTHLLHVRHYGQGYVDAGSYAKDETVREVQTIQLTKYWVCITCGSLTPTARGLCAYCSTPLPNFLRSPEPSQVSRGVHLGFLSAGSEFRISLSAFGLHFAFYGVTGSGKTRGAMRLAVESEKAGIKLLILDVEGEWKNIIPHLKGETQYYATDDNLRINPYDLNDYGLVRTLLKETIFKGIEVEYQDISPQMNYVLDKCIKNSTSIPTLIDNIISYEEESLPFKLVNLDRTKTALLVRLEPYRSNPALSEIFYTETSSITLDGLDTKNFVIDLHSLEAQVAYRTELRLIYNAIAIAYLKLALHREITDTISNLFIADEAQILVPKILRKVVVTDTHLSTEFSSRLRKRGQSVAIITQSPSNIEDDIRGNCQNVFVFRLQDAKDTGLVARSFGYSSYTALDCFSHELSSLKQRQAIVKMPLVDEPFIITAPEVSVNPIAKEELDRHSPRIPADTLSVMDGVSDRNALLSSDEEVFLQSIGEKPFISMVDRRASLGWDEKHYSNVVERLTRKNLIRKVRVRVGRGGPLTLYETPDQNPSIKHQYFVHWIVEWLTARGLECRAEKNGSDIVIPEMNASGTGGAGEIKGGRQHQDSIRGVRAGYSLQRQQQGIANLL